MDHRPLRPSTFSGFLLPWNTDGSGLSHHGLCWIITLLFFTISSYLYFCKSWCISLSITNHLVWPALFQVTMVDRRSCGSDSTWWCLILLSRLLGTHTFHINCIRHSVNATCKLICCSFLYTRNLWHVCCPGRGIPPLWLFLRFLPSFFFTLLKGSFFPPTWQVFPHSNRGSKDRWCCSLYRL